MRNSDAVTATARPSTSTRTALGSSAQAIGRQDGRIGLRAVAPRSWARTRAISSRGLNGLTT